MTFIPDDLIWLIKQLIPSIKLTVGYSGYSGNTDNFDNFDKVSKIELFSDLVIKPEYNI